MWTSGGPNGTPLIVPLSSSRGWKRPERISEDAEPTRIIYKSTPGQRREGTDLSALHSRGTNNSENDTALGVCVVCSEHVSRYTCPRCQTPYCSVPCYRNHTSGGTEDETEEPSACTEAFYKHRVGSILELEARERKEETHRLLNRHYQQQQHQANGSMGTLQLTEDDAEHDLIAEEELYALLEKLEANPENEDEMTQEHLLSMMSPELRATFQRDVQNGNLPQDLVLQRWHPWWRRELVSNSDVPESDGDHEVSCATASVSKVPLDERLMQVPMFSSLMASPSKGLSPTEPPQLLYNLVNIIYSYCWTLRLYHGIDNAKGALVAVEATNALIQHATVLQSDARFTAGLEEVLIESTARSTRHFPTGECNADWAVLVEDVALLVTNNRFVGRALLEASDLLKAGMRDLKKKHGKAKESHEKVNDPSLNGFEAITQMRRIRKKLEFFLSWSQQTSQWGEDLKMEFMNWMERWKLRSVEEEGAQEALRDLELPARLLPKKIAGAAPPLMVEVATKRQNH